MKKFTKRQFTYYKSKNLDKIALFFALFLIGKLSESLLYPVQSFVVAINWVEKTYIPKNLIKKFKNMRKLWWKLLQELQSFNYILKHNVELLRLI